MVKIYPSAEFDADFPDDMVEEDGEIALFPGRNVAEAIVDLLRRAGLTPGEPTHQGEHGWAFDTKFKERALWIQVTTFEDQHFYMDTEDTTFMSRFLRAPKAAYVEFLVVLNREINADSRFRNLTWFAAKDLKRNNGMATPVED